MLSDRASALVFWFVLLAVPSLDAQVTVTPVPYVNSHLLAWNSSLSRFVSIENDQYGGPPMLVTLDPVTGTGTQQYLPVPSGGPFALETWVNGVSPNGRWALGRVDTIGWQFEVTRTEPILWDLTNGTYTLPGLPVSPCLTSPYLRMRAVSDSGECFGPWQTPAPHEIYRWSPVSGWTIFPADPASGSTCSPVRIEAVSADGTVLSGSLQDQATTWDLASGSPVPLTLPPQVYESSAKRISPCGNLSAGHARASSALYSHSAYFWRSGVPFPVPPFPGLPSHSLTIEGVTSSGFVFGRIGVPNGSPANLPIYDSPLFFTRLGWERSFTPHQYLTGELGVTLPGTNPIVRWLWMVVERGDVLHLLVLVQDFGGPVPHARYLVTIPGAAKSTAIQATTDAAGQTWLCAAGLAPGSELTTIFSTETTAPLGGGPYLGLYASDLSDLIWQVLVPAGTPPFRYTASSEVDLFGPYWLPTGYSLDLLSIEGAWPVYGDASRVSRFLVP